MALDDDPLKILSSWHSEATAKSGPPQQAAVCLSTVDEYTRPQARFVAIKDISSEGVTFCTSLESPKAREIAMNRHVALTAWWAHTGKQFRLVGDAYATDRSEAARFFRQRPRSAQLTSYSTHQSESITDFGTVADRIAQTERLLNDREVPMPDGWGCFRVVPEMIEFLSFSKARDHRRVRFTRTESGWRGEYLQP